MSSDTKSNDNPFAEVVFPLMIGAAILTLFVAVSGAVLGYGVSKKRDKILNFTAPLSILGVLFVFWGVPYLYSPTWDAQSTFKSYYPNGEKYFLPPNKISAEIKDLLKENKYLKDDIKSHRKSNETGYYTDIIKNKTKEIIVNSKELKKLKFIKKMSKQRRNGGFDSLNFKIFINRKTESYLIKHYERQLWFYLWFVASFLLALFLGASIKTKGVFEKIEKLGNVLSMPGVGIAFVIRKIFDIENPKVIQDRHLKKDAFVFGSEQGYLSNANLALHTQVVGGSGVGKTNFLKNFIADRVGKGKGLIFLDFKADFEVLEWMQGLMFATNRSDFKVFTLSDPEHSVPYNPIEFGNSTEIVSQIMNSLIWSEEYYKNYAENALLMSLNLLTYIRDRDKKRFHLGHLLKLLTSSKYRYHLLDMAIGYRYRDDLADLFNEMDSKKGVEKLSGLVIQLKKIIYSSAGDTFTANCERFEPLKFRDAIKNGEVVYLFMNSMSLKKVASSVGKMILQDLMKEVGHLYDSQVKLVENVSLVIDEFASFATPDFISFLDKARGAGIEVMLAHQSMSDLKEISENFGTRVLENTASKVIFNTQLSVDVEVFAGIVGTYEDTEDTVQVSDSGLFGMFFGKSETGVGSRKTVERFNIHPNTFKRLRQGEAIVMASKVDVHYGTTQIDRAPEFRKLCIEWDCINNKKRSEQSYIDLSTGDKSSSNISTISDIESDGIDNI